MSELLGYQVEKHNTEGSEKRMIAAYTLSDRNGPKYKLIRNTKNPNMLFAIHTRKLDCAIIKGYKWFTDKDGELKPIS